LWEPYKSRPVDWCTPDAREATSDGHSEGVLIIVAPGQGAQTPGFLTPWLEDTDFAARIDWLSAVAGLDLAHYGSEADADTLRDTAIAQPLLVAAGLVTAVSLFPHPADAFNRIGAVAGHSVGELTAAAGARAITAEQAMVLVRERGKAMATAAAATPTGMSAVLGGDPDEVLATLDRFGLTAANINGAGQIVAAGTLTQLADLAAEPPAGARVRALPVAGAFHTHHMGSAVDTLARLGRSVYTHDPRTPVISNRDGRVVHDGHDVVRRIVGQVSSPVRWDLCMETMADLGVTGILEMPPAGTLVGLAKRALPGVETLALKTPDQLDDARAFVEKHGSHSSFDTSPTWRMLVAPAKGTFSRIPAQEGDALRATEEIGTITSLRDQIPVVAPHGGTIVEWLVEDGDLVSPGQPLVRLHPEGVPA
jgi:[acyl-carrier-protein] S-malonyltransferase